MTPQECLVCGRKLVYTGKSERKICELCGGTFESDCSCESGHYVCDSCHRSPAVAVVDRVCKATSSDDPLAIAIEIMSDPCVHMHGPEHHVLVGAALLAAYKNAGGSVDFQPALREMIRRGSSIPGGVCGSAGCCGAAISAGAFYSIITDTTPLSGKSWRDANALTSKCLSAISAHGGPRCCKRDTIAAIGEAVAFVVDNLGVDMSFPERPYCNFSSRNLQCLKDGCPFRASPRPGGNLTIPQFV